MLSDMRTEMPGRTRATAGEPGVEQTPLPRPALGVEARGQDGAPVGGTATVVGCQPLSGRGAELVDRRHVASPWRDAAAGVATTCQIVTSSAVVVSHVSKNSRLPGLVMYFLPLGEIHTMVPSGN